jgi:hypothetical protein
MPRAKKGLLVMISSRYSNNDIQREKELYTLVSTFEKKNSLSYKLLFGTPEITRPTESLELPWENAFEHLFLPQQIFGIELKSQGKDYQKFHYALVVRSCGEGERGTIVPGIIPGAEVLIQTTNYTATKNLKIALNKILLCGLDLTKIAPEKFRQLNNLLLLKMTQKFFVGELVG